MYYTTPNKKHKSKKIHRCSNCAQTIEVGETYIQWMSIGEDNKSLTNKMHLECYDELAEDGYFEYTFYSSERPIPLVLE